MSLTAGTAALAVLASAVLLMGCATPTAAPPSPALAERADARRRGDRDPVARGALVEPLRRRHARPPGRAGAGRPAGAARGAGAHPRGRRRRAQRRRGAPAARRAQRRCHRPALQRERHLPAAAGRLDALDRRRAAPASAGSSTSSAASAPRSTPRSARARRAGRRAGRARAARGQRRRQLLQAGAADRAARRRRRGAAAARTGRSRWCASASPPASTPTSSCARPRAWSRSRKVEIEALDEAIGRTRHALAALAAQRPQALDALAPALAAVRAVPLPDSAAGRPAGPPRRHGGAALARRGGDARRRRGARAVLSERQPDRLRRPVSARPEPAARQPARSTTASARRSACRSSTPAACAPTSTRARADLDAAIESYNGALLDAVREVADQIDQPALDRAPAGARSATRRPPPKRAYDLARAALPRRPGQLPRRAERRDQRADAAPRSAPT